MQGTLYAANNEKESAAVTGRPVKKWEQLSLRTKRRRLSGLKDEHETMELVTVARKRGLASPGNENLGR